MRTIQEKRSFSLAGHRTSVALEREFWAVLETAARRRGVRLVRFVAAVDAARGTERTLASALRVTALAEAGSPPAAEGQVIETDRENGGRNRD